jgi:hypothetical protein
MTRIGCDLMRFLAVVQVELVCLQDSCAHTRVSLIYKHALESWTRSGRQTLFLARIYGQVRSRLLHIRLQLERDYPLNLSILVSGGKETN